MKNIVYTTLALLILSGVYAQNQDTKKADVLFESYQFTPAIKEYEKLVKNKKADSYVYNQLGEAYYYLNNSEKAAENYAKAIKKGQNAQTYFNYAQVLRAQGKHAEANKQMDKFASLVPNDQRAIAYRTNPDYLKSLQSMPKLYEIKEATINNPDSNDFSAILTSDNIVHFVSNRSGKQDKRGTGIAYQDIFRSVHSDAGTFSEPISVTDLNSKFHDGPLTFSADGKYVYFSRDGRSEGAVAKDKNANARIGTVGIYRAEKKDGKWTKIKPLPFNSTEYNAGNPSLSKDGKTLYFASDMPGGFGGTDIWKVTINKNGTYGKPENLGEKVNTPGRETFPFVDDLGTIYFSSNGRLGFGGLDVFKLEVGANQAVNVGEPINSEKDDFGFTFNNERNVGFVSSNRKGTDNIYHVLPICRRDALVIVKDATNGQVLDKVVVTMTDAYGETYEQNSTNSRGETNFQTDCYKEFVLQGSRAGYEPNSAVLVASKGEKTTTEILLTPEVVIVPKVRVELNPIHFDFDKSTITEESAKELDRLVKVMNDYPDMVIFVRSHTDHNGSLAYNDRLSERRAKSTVDYVISKGISKKRISGKGFGKREPLINCGENCTEEQDATNRRSEFLIVSGGPEE